MNDLHGDRVVLRPVIEADVAELRAIHETPEVVRWWNRPDEGWPLEDDEDAVFLTILVDGAVAGFIQFSEENEPDYRHASIDIFLDPRRHGQGLGTDAVRTLARHLIEERGHHRVTIDPSVGNAPAIRSYEKVGFRPVGVMRRYTRDPLTGEWVDGLLMDLLADELTR
jgi:aminoglycoside 6'-N-acetyltransferase